MDKVHNPKMTGNPLPLTGKRVMVTRAPHQASDLTEGLRQFGATVLAIPTIEIGPPASYAALDAALASLPTFAWLVFTSANAVRAFAERAGSAITLPATISVAAVGPATARAAQAVGMRVDLTPPIFTAESLAATLLPRAQGRTLLLVLAEDAPSTLADILAPAAARITIAAAYANRIPQSSPAQIAAALSNTAHMPHAITFTSASTARNLVALLGAASVTLPNSIARISIGPVTSRALAELGLPAHAEAAESTIPALIAAVCLHLESTQ